MAKKTLEEQIAADEQAAQAGSEQQPAENTAQAAPNGVLNESIVSEDEKAKAQAEADAKAKAEADAKAKAEADAKAKKEADKKAQADNGKKARDKRAKELLNDYPEKNKIYFTSDNTPFFGLCDAMNHAKTLEDADVIKIER